jgi:hypothetical protein
VGRLQCHSFDADAPPATAASKPSRAPPDAVAASTSGSVCARRALFAVTTCFPLRAGVGDDVRRVTLARSRYAARAQHQQHTYFASD